MPVSNKRSRFQCLRWLILALVILATPSLANASPLGAKKLGSYYYVIGNDNDLYTYSPMFNTWQKENFPYLPIVDVAEGDQYIYVLAYKNSGGGYYLWRRPWDGDVGDWDWEYFDTPSQGTPKYGNKTAAVKPSYGNGVALGQSNAQVWQWIEAGYSGYWRIVQYAIAYDITAAHYCYAGGSLEGNLFFMSTNNDGFRWNGTSFTRYAGVKLKSLVGPVWDYYPTGLDTSGKLHIWNGTKWTNWANVTATVSDLWSSSGWGGTQQPVTLEGSCSGGGQQVVEYVWDGTSKWTRSPVGPNNGCLTP